MGEFHIGGSTWAGFHNSDVWQACEMKPATQHFSLWKKKLSLIHQVRSTTSPRVKERVSTLLDCAILFSFSILWERNIQPIMKELVVLGGSMLGSALSVSFVGAVLTTRPHGRGYIWAGLHMGGVVHRQGSLKFRVVPKFSRVVITSAGLKLASVMRFPQCVMWSSQLEKH